MSKKNGGENNERLKELIFGFILLVIVSIGSMMLGSAIMEASIESGYVDSEYQGVFHEGDEY